MNKEEEKRIKEFLKLLDDYVDKEKIRGIIEELNSVKLQDERLDKASIDFVINKIQELLEGENK